MPAPAPISAACLDCGLVFPYSGAVVDCPACRSPWLEAGYDFAFLGACLPDLLRARPFDLWRYRELLPVGSPDPGLSMGEGGTPLIHAANLGMMLGLPRLYLKDERQGPTASFKDRQAAVHIAALKEAGITEAVLASTGNVAIAYSAFAARAGIKLWAFLTSLVPAEKMREVALYGTEVVKVTASYDQVKQVAADFARQRGLYLERGARSIASVEAMKTVAFEVAEQLAARFGPSEDGRGVWRAPDWYFQSISGGLGPLGVLKGFAELERMGLTGSQPALGGIQAEGCAPMVAAWKAGATTAEPVRSPQTRIATLATGDPGRTYTLLRRRMHAGGGLFESVSDEEAYRAMHILAKMEGISVEPAAAVAVAGLIRLVRQGQVKPAEIVVVNLTGHTMPIEPALLGENWGRSVALPTSPQAAGQAPALPPAASAEREGLLAALNRVTADRFPRVLIVDDTPDARRLIRRILQSQGEYSLFEAACGAEALDLAGRELPDLVILDLMMPGMDGFAVLQALKADPRTSTIPVIVVTAKELTLDEQERMKGQIQALMLKGEFLNEDLLHEVQQVIQTGP